MVEKEKVVVKKKKVVAKITSAVVSVRATFNNTIITVADQQGNVLAWSSPGIVGFSGSKKSTPFAAQVAASDAAKKAKERGVVEVEVRVKGPGSGREAAVRALKASGLKVTSVKDLTPQPHNGCRPRKRRRV
ncbi:MAG: 30S ribosomal protein S11 [Candidatus Omnitrophica bacterium]|nr:30S ribosomal protein S11 [Candidatus Omnitrophota bacterium]